ncbi:17041_t:CDS:1 [Acaulospora colombiana]|uniref:17041_t:CDS:1 n=1 Tax=Acaulospora colombiana TaxID=27376 RepID=A0ACA9P5P9_9GLOM|nr:17041_t:CDS:1 [Acaulospora colombiana]
MDYTPQAAMAWIISVLALASEIYYLYVSISPLKSADLAFVLNTTSHCLKNNLFVASFVTSTLTTIFTGNILIWIVIACRKWNASQNHYRAWLVALFSQVLNIIIAAAQMPHTNLALYLTRGFSLLLWVLSTMFFVSRKFGFVSCASPMTFLGIDIARIETTTILSPVKPPETFQAHPKRHVSASEDFRCRDPFAGPLGVSSHTISAIPLTHAASYKSLLSVTSKRQNKTRFVPPKHVPKPSLLAA